MNLTKSLLKLINYTAAGMVVVPIVLIILTSVDYYGRMVVHAPWLWVPVSSVLAGVSMYIFHITSERIDAAQ